MKKISIILFSAFCFLQLWGQTNNKNQELTIRVLSRVDKKPIEKAIVEIRGLITKKTNADGITLFENVPKRNYEIEVRANGYKPYRGKFNVGEMRNPADNYWDVELEPVPKNSFLITGKVIYNEEPLENTEVHFRAISKIKGSINYVAYTDEWGYYSFIIAKDTIETEKDIRITIGKDGFKGQEKKVGLNEDNEEINDVILKKKIDYCNTAKYGSAGIGGVTFATGLILALDTRSDWKNSNRGQILYDSLNRKFKKRTAVAGVGLLFIAGGAILHFMRNDKKDKDKISRIQLTPKISNLAFIDPKALNQNSYEIGLTFNF